MTEIVTNFRWCTKAILLGASTAAFLTAPATAQMASTSSADEVVDEDILVLAPIREAQALAI